MAKPDWLHFPAI